MVLSQHTKYSEYQLIYLLLYLISGTFELTDDKGHSTGTISVELKWKFAYLQPAGLIVAADLADYIQNEKPVKGQGEGPILAPSFSSAPMV